MSKVIKWLMIGVGGLLVMAVLGPQPDYPIYDLKPIDLYLQLANVDDYIWQIMVALVRIHLKD